jgi:putative transposase
VVVKATGLFFICIVVDDKKTPPTKPPVTNSATIGIDVGLTTYVTLSTGEKIANPRHHQNMMQRLRCLHRRLSKKLQGGKNREKARLRLARCFERITYQRQDFQHKLSIRLIHENQAIVIEHLNIRSMVRNQRLGKSILDAAWSRFICMLKYKANWYGVTLIEVGRFEPTSKCCHSCGTKNNTLNLSDREWKCPTCGMQHDRDINAAKNIRMMGLKSIITPSEPRVEPVELSALAEAMKQETPSSSTG